MEDIMANIVTKTYDLNITPGGVRTLVNLSQYENGRQLVFRLVGDANISIPSGSTAVIEGTKPDGNVYSGTGTVDAAAGTVTFQEEVQMTAVAGEYMAKVKVLSGSQMVASGIITMLISMDPVSDGAVESDSDVQGLIAEARQVYEGIQNDLNSLDTEVDVLSARMDNFAQLPSGSTSGDAELIDIRVGADGTTYPTAGDAVRGQVNDLKAAIMSSLEINGLSYNFGVVDIPQAQITDAQSKGVTCTVNGNTFTLNGTATGSIMLNLDFNKIKITQRPIYFYIKRSDGAKTQSGVYLHISYYNNDGDPVSSADTINIFNDLVPYSYSENAKYTRNYFFVAAGTSFDNVQFEYNFLNSPPLDIDAIEASKGLFTQAQSFIPLTWEAATGYWASNGTFVTYGKIHTATIDVQSGDVYSLTARSFYGVAVAVFYTGDDVATGIVSLVRISDADKWEYNYELIVPSGAEHLMIQQYNGSLREIMLECMLYQKSENLIAKTALSNKLIAYNGDSICEGRYSGTADNGGGYAKLIADKVSCQFENRAISGGILASAVPSGNAPARFVVTDVAKMRQDADLICFEGGINDFYRDVPLGTFDPDDYTGSVDTATVCGALESIFRQAIVKWQGKPICFVIVHRCWSTKQPNNAGYTFSQLRESAIGICQKYSIPFYDAYTKSGLNAYNPDQTTAFLTAGSSGGPDGMHPNEAGYKAYYVPQLIDLFESILYTS